MTQASQKITQQYVDGGVIPAHLVGQDATSKTYVDGQLGIRDKDISAAQNSANAAQKSINDHRLSTNAHAAQNITYSGEVAGVGDVKQAIDAVKTTVDLAIVSGDSGPEARTARYSTPQNKTYPSLKDRLDASDTFEIDIENAVAIKADKSYTDSQLNFKRDKSTKINSEDLNTSQDSLKIKLVNLSDEVKQAMAGTTPINATPGNKEVTREKLADHAVSDLQIENQGIRLDKINNDVSRFDGYVISAKGGSLSVSNIRAAFLFDLLPVGIVATTATTFTFEACFRCYDTNLKQFSTRHYWNNSNVANDSSGNVSTPTLQVVNYAEFIKYSVTFTLTNNQRYIHSFVFADLLNPALVTNLEVNSVTLRCNGFELAPQGYALFGQNTTDSIKYLEFKPNNLISISDFRSIAYQSSEKTWNVLGDSLSGNSSFTSKFYHEIVKEKLGISTVNNYSVGGTSITVRAGRNDSFLERFPSMSDADFITVFGGTNDVSVPLGTFADTSNMTFYGAAKLLVAGLIEKYPGKKIGFILPLQRYDSGNPNINPLVKERVDALREVCEFYSIPYIDLWRNGGIYPASTQVRNVMIPDGLHLNTAGHAFISSKIAGFLEGL